MHIVDLIVFLVFTCGVMLLGCSFFKKKTSSDEFTSAGRSLPGWVVGMSIFATYVSSISYLGNPGMAFAGDWNAFVFSLSIPVASYFAAKYFVPFYRNMGSVSAYSFLEERFGPWARMYASMCYLLTQIARMGSILFLLALPMNSLMGWNIPLVIVVTSIAIIVYSMMGGMKGVIWTEAMQGFILIGGAVVCLFVLLFKMPEGPMQTFEIAMQDNKFYLGDLTTNIDTSTLWVCLIYGLFINLQNYGIDQNYVQRYLTAKSEREAKFSALFGGYLYIPVSAVFFLIGTALYAYYKVYPDLLPADIAQKADYVFPYFIVHELPVGVTGLLIASIFAAGMSNLRGRGLADYAVRRAQDTPLLGICLGMQILLDESEEEGLTAGLGLVRGRAVRFTEGKIPQIGWNAVTSMRSPLFAGIPEGTQFYFVHSYYADTAPAFTLGETEYFRTYASAVGAGNVYGVQFHPEKSGAAGLQLLRNFMRL